MTIVEREKLKTKKEILKYEGLNRIMQLNGGVQTLNTVNSLVAYSNIFQTLLVSTYVLIVPHVTLSIIGNKFKIILQFSFK